VGEGDTEGVELFVQAGFRRFQVAKDVEGRSLIHAVVSTQQACYLGHLGLVRLFVNCCKAGFQEVDDEGSKPADLATPEVREFLATVDWDSADSDARAESNPFLKKKPEPKASHAHSGADGELPAQQVDRSQAADSRKKSDSLSQ
jgi:hypothetical protein